MLASISEKLTDEGLSIENVTTELRKGKRGRRLFVVNADCVGTRYMSNKRILEMSSELGDLKKSLDLDVVDVRVQRFDTDLD